MAVTSRYVEVSTMSHRLERALRARFQQSIDGWLVSAGYRRRDSAPSTPTRRLTLVEQQPAMVTPSRDRVAA
jgi:hypothetical protein